MNENLLYTLIGVGLLVILVLALYIFKLLKAEQQRKRELQAREQRLADEAQKQRDYLLESIRVISSALLNDDKITLTEGCIRLKVMIDNLDPTLHQDSAFDVFDEVYNRTRHIPILADWRDLERKEKRKFEREMQAIEAECEARIRSAAAELLKHPMHDPH